MAISSLVCGRRVLRHVGVCGANDQPVERGAGAGEGRRVARDDDRRDHRLVAEIRQSFRLSRQRGKAGERIAERVAERQAVAGEIDYTHPHPVTHPKSQPRQRTRQHAEGGREFEWRVRLVFSEFFLAIARHRVIGIGVAAQVFAGPRRTEAPAGPARDRFVQIQIAVRRVRARRWLGGGELHETFLLRGREKQLADAVLAASQM